MSKFRWIILISSFIVLLFGAYAGLYFGYFLPTFSCCYVQARAGTCFMLTLQQTLGAFTMESMVLFAERLLLFSLLVIVLGKAWCGWVCPLGLFQDLFDWVRKKLHISGIRFSTGMKKSLSWVKWAFLSVALLLPIWVAFPVGCPCVALGLNVPYCQLCPGKYILPLMVGNPDRVAVNFKNATTIVMSSLGLTFSGIAFLFAFAKRRFWCTLCPLGLILSWYRKISFLKLKKSDENCTRCEICYNVCPVDIEEVYRSRGRKDVTFSDCTLCLKCVENCPEPDALSASYLGGTIYRSSTKRFFNNRRISLSPNNTEEQS